MVGYLPLCLAIVVLLQAPATSAPASVNLVDDQGKALRSTVEACFQVELAQRCSPIAPAGVLALLPSFDSVRVEGQDYGPATASAREVLRLQAGSLPFSIPRKGTLVVRGPKGQLPAVSLYRLDEPELRRPVVRSKLTEGSMKVPAGVFVVSLSRLGTAPDLHAVEVTPGSKKELRFTPRPGWSLVLHVTDLGGEKPVSKALVGLRGAAGYSAPGSGPRSRATDAHGLALFSGLSDAMAEGSVEHPAYVKREVPGLLASPGSFTYHAVRLEKGGALRATVLVEGEPAAQASCEVVRYDRQALEPSPEPEIFAKGLTDQSGVYVSERLAAGPYFLRISVDNEAAGTTRAVGILEGVETPVSIELSPIRVSGAVRLGTKPARGFGIAIHNNDAPIPNRMPKDAAARASTDEDGKYEAVVWSPGNYMISAYSPEGTPASLRRIELAGAEEVVDFQLEEAGVTGVVVDQAGKPVEGALVSLRWEMKGGASLRLARTAADGVFSFPMEDAGPVTLQAGHDGYRSSEQVGMVFASGAVFPPVSLVLEKQRALRGVVVDSRGNPPTQAWVATYSASTGDVPRRVGDAWTKRDGSFVVPIAQQGMTRAFVTGPGCPLTAAEAMDTEQEVRYACTPSPSALAITVKDREGRPVRQESVILRQNGRVIPREVVAAHLSFLRLPTETDGTGHLVIAGLAPGGYDVYLSSSTSEDLVARGTQHGYLGTFSLAPFTLSEVEVAMDWDKPLVEAPPGH